MDKSILTCALLANSKGLIASGLMLSPVLQDKLHASATAAARYQGHRIDRRLETPQMPFLKVMGMTILAIFLQGMAANAQTMRPADRDIISKVEKEQHARQTLSHTDKATKADIRKPKVEKVVLKADKPTPRRNKDKAQPQTTAERQIYCMGQVMANEAKPNLKGWVSVNYALMVRGVSGEYGARGDFCAAAHAKNQFTAFKKRPTADMLKVAKQMYNDWKNGKPTIEVAMQNQLNGSAYFHNDTVRPDWSRRFTRTMVVEGHYMYRAKGDVSPYSFTLASK